VWNRDETPTIYRPLPGSERVHNGPEPPAGFPEVFDAIIVLECPSPDRTGLEEHLGALPVINIDHHLGNQHYGVINWVDTAAPAVGEMVYRLAQSLKLALEPETASCLYLTLVTDTGGFRFSNTRPHTLRVAADLLETGVDPEQIYLEVYARAPEGRPRLFAEALQTLVVEPEYGLAWVTVPPGAIERHNVSSDDLDGVVEFPRSIQGVRMALLFREIAQGRVKVSLRSVGDVDVARFAKGYGGGGHTKAAGLSLVGSLAEVQSTVLKAAREYLGVDGKAGEAEESEGRRQNDQRPATSD